MKHVDHTKPGKKTFWLEVIMFILVTTVAFIAMTQHSVIAGYEAEFNWMDKDKERRDGVRDSRAYRSESRRAFTEGENGTACRSSRAFSQAEKLNTVIWSFGAGPCVYGALRLIIRKRISRSIQPLVKNVNLDLVDEIGYQRRFNRISGFYTWRAYFRDDLGTARVEQILGLGSEGSMGADYIFVLCSLSCISGFQEAGTAKNQRGSPSSVLPLLCLILFL